MYESAWSGTSTAKRFAEESSEGPFGTAQDLSVPSISSRKSQCSRLAWCSCTTNRKSRAIGRFCHTARPRSPHAAPVRHGRSPVCHTTLHRRRARPYSRTLRPTAPPRADSVNRDIKGSPDAPARRDGRGRGCVEEARQGFSRSEERRVGK